MKLLLQKIILAAIAFFFFQCSSFVQIGKLNMVANRNIDSGKEYRLLKSYAGGGQKELKKSKYVTLEEAVDGVVRSTAGGEYLMNVKIYEVNKKYFAVEGDIWGVPGVAEFKGFKVGDKVQWKTLTSKKQGTITSLHNDKVCLVKEDGKEDAQEIKYEDLFKMGN